MAKIISDDMLPTGVEAPKIEFPCDYPIKILGQACEEFNAIVTEVVKKHAPDFNPENISARDSRKGTFRSVTVTITATGHAQIESIFVDLKAISIVKMVL